LKFLEQCSATLPEQQRPPQQLLDELGYKATRR